MSRRFGGGETAERLRPRLKFPLACFEAVEKTMPLKTGAAVVDGWKAPSGLRSCVTPSEKVPRPDFFLDHLHFLSGKDGKDLVAALSPL